MTDIAWWEGLNFELDVSTLTLGDLVAALDDGVLDEIWQIFGVDPGVVTPARVRAVIWTIERAAKKERPETTRDEVLALPWRVALGAAYSTGEDAGE